MGYGEKKTRQDIPESRLIFSKGNGSDYPLLDSRSIQIISGRVGKLPGDSGQRNFGINRTFFARNSRAAVTSPEGGGLP